MVRVAQEFRAARLDIQMNLSSRRQTWLQSYVQALRGPWGRPLCSIWGVCWLPQNRPAF